MDYRDSLALASRITNGHALAALRTPIGSAYSLDSTSRLSCKRARKTPTLMGIHLENPR